MWFFMSAGASAGRGGDMVPLAGCSELVSLTGGRGPELAAAVAVHLVAVADLRQRRLDARQLWPAPPS